MLMHNTIVSTLTRFTRFTTLTKFIRINTLTTFTTFTTFCNSYSNSSGNLSGTASFTSLLRHKSVTLLFLLCLVLWLAQHFNAMAAIDKAGIGNPAIDNPAIDKTGIDNPAINNPAIDKTGIGNPGIDKTGIDKTGIDNPAIDKTGIGNPAIDKTGIDNPAIYNSAIVKTGIDKTGIDNPAINNPALDKTSIDNTAIGKRAIVYVNGMDTSRIDAIQNINRVDSSFRRLTNAEKIDLVYNADEFILLELAEAGVQLLKQSANLNIRKAWTTFAIAYFIASKNPFLEYAKQAFLRFNESNYVNDLDLAKLVSKVVALVEDQYKVVIFAHSQGNFYANRAWDRINQMTHDSDLSQAVGIVGIATPANRVAGNGLYTTNSNDLVIHGIRLAAPDHLQPLPNNATHPVSLADPTGHGLKEIYLSDGMFAGNIKNKSVQSVNTMFNRLRVVEPTGCENFIAGIGGQWFGSYSPGNYTGYLTYSFNAYQARNSLRLIAENDITLLNTNGFRSGIDSGRFYYDSASNGRVSIEVLAETVTGDDWDLSITCP